MPCNFTARHFLLYVFFEFQSADQVKLQLILIYNHDLLNDTFKCRFFKLGYRIISLFKKINQHFNLIKRFILIVGTCKLFQLGLQFIDFSCKSRSLLNILSLVQKSFCFQPCEYMCLLLKFCDFFVNIHMKEVLGIMEMS